MSSLLRREIKMKKLLGLITIVVMICAQTFLVSADSFETEERVVSVERQYLENGDYIETIITESPIASYASNTKTGSKTSQYCNSGVALWYVKVTGTFTYTGSSVYCTGASVTAGSYHSDWGVSNRSSSYSGNIATAKATGRRYYGNTAVERINETVHLSCSVNGSLY